MDIGPWEPLQLPGLKNRDIGERNSMETKAVALARRIQPTHGGLARRELDAQGA